MRTCCVGEWVPAAGDPSMVPVDLLFGSNSPSLQTPLEKRDLRSEVPIRMGWAAKGIQRARAGPCELEPEGVGRDRCTPAAQAYRDDSRHGCEGLARTRVCMHPGEGKAHAGPAQHGGHTRGSRRAAPRCRWKSRQTGDVSNREGRECRGGNLEAGGYGLNGDGASDGGAAARPARPSRNERSAALWVLGEPPCCGGEIWSALRDARPNRKGRCRPRKRESTPRGWRSCSCHLRQASARMGFSMNERRLPRRLAPCPDRNCW